MSSSVPPPPPSTSASHSVRPKTAPKFIVKPPLQNKETPIIPPPPPTSTNSTMHLITRKTAIIEQIYKNGLFDELKSKVKPNVEQYKIVPYKINEPSNNCELEVNNEKGKLVRFVVTSDTHNKHGMLEIPDADVFLHCGDFTYAGSEREISNFNDFLGTVKCKHRIVICGNHEHFKSKEKYEVLLSNATKVLMNSSVIVEGIKIYGTPFVPNMGNFQGENYFTKLMDNTGHYKKEEDLKAIYDMIDNDTDILMTHTPPNKILDGSGKYGSYALMERLSQLTNVKVSCFGHVHGAYGFQKVGKTLFVNASSDGVEQPIVFDYVIPSQ